MTETILVGSEIKEVRAPELTVFEASEVVGTGRFYLLSIAVLVAVTKSALIFRTNNIALAGPGEAPRVRGVHEEAGRLRLVLPADREDAGLTRRGSSQHSGAGEGEAQHAWLQSSPLQVEDQVRGVAR